MEHADHYECEHYIDQMAGGIHEHMLTHTNTFTLALDIKSALSKRLVFE